jgi:hypothetical protein
MCFEGVSYCDCESEAQVAFESADRTPEAVLDGPCEECEYENEADVFYVRSRDGVVVPTCYECVRDYEAGDQEYKDMMDHSGQY